jgi:plasmid stabilization system protein ParE
VSDYRIVAETRAENDVRSAFAWYENERVGLGTEFLEEIRAAYRRVVSGPFGYQRLEQGVRRARRRRFPYSVYFAVEADMIRVIAVLHTSRHPSAWQQRRDL